MGFSIVAVEKPAKNAVNSKSGITAFLAIPKVFMNYDKITTFRYGLLQLFLVLEFAQYIRSKWAFFEAVASQFGRLRDSNYTTLHQFCRLAWQEKCCLLLD